MKVSLRVNGERLAGDVYLGMDAPLTGPTGFVGQGDRETVDALVKYWNDHGGIKELPTWAALCWWILPFIQDRWNCG